MLKGYRTLIFNLVALVATALGYTAVPEEVLAEYTDAIILIGGALITGGNLVLRLVTTGPIFGKDSDPEKKPATKKRGKAAAIALPILLLIIGAGLSACSTRVVEKTSPMSVKLTAIEKDFNVAQTEILQFFRSGYATDEVKTVVKKLEASAKNALDAAWEAHAKGDNPAIAAGLSAARSAVDELVAYLKRSGRLGEPPPKVSWFARVPLTVLED